MKNKRYLLIPFAILLTLIFTSCDISITWWGDNKSLVNQNFNGTWQEDTSNNQGEKRYVTITDDNIIITIGTSYSDSLSDVEINYKNHYFTYLAEISNIGTSSFLLTYTKSNNDYRYNFLLKDYNNMEISMQNSNTVQFSRITQ